jgi:hypothetical protein
LLFCLKMSTELPSFFVEPIKLATIKRDNAYWSL